jgi:hypothetical protein
MCYNATRLRLFLVVAAFYFLIAAATSMMTITVMCCIFALSSLCSLNIAVFLQLMRAHTACNLSYTVWRMAWCAIEWLGRIYISSGSRISFETRNLRTKNMGFTRFAAKSRNIHGFLLTKKVKQTEITPKQVKTYFERFLRLLSKHNENNMAGSSPCVVCSFTASKRYLNIANLWKQNCATGPSIVTFTCWWLLKHLKLNNFNRFNNDHCVKVCRFLTLHM